MIETYINKLILMCENRYCKTEDDKLMRDNEIEHYKTIKQKLKEEVNNITIKNYNDILNFLDNKPISIIDDKVHEKVDAITLVKKHLQEDWVREKLKGEINK